MLKIQSDLHTFMFPHSENKGYENICKKKNIVTFVDTVISKSHDERIGYIKPNIHLAIATVSVGKHMRLCIHFRFSSYLTN